MSSPASPPSAFLGVELVRPRAGPRRSPTKAFPKFYDAWRFEREVLGQPNPPGQAVAGFARSLLEGVYRIPNRVLQAPPSSSKTVANTVKEISRVSRFKRTSRAVKAAILQGPPAAAAQAQAGASASASAILSVTKPLDAKPRKLTRRQRQAEVEGI
ncbi:hypothetical protein PHLGIDRAFT_118898 [Phlebiopsis gigantea 11061_1 CR5-6]|uniref:Uncharacterized protein n=1 Tax=Phlebiopsis gigantea (strain 11061_1 CR5-6) TaxID=745531 RepID=A0A0C3PJV1_PHLG1|nr:hypothetical protein PHLGIDRAFT_118898 [Phlebiopsis gigantea 11061_1 CR5-6]